MTPKVLLDQAFSLHQQGKLAEAEQLFLQIVAAEPASFTPRHMLGIICAQQGRNAEALEQIGGALKIHPDDVEALSNYGNILKALGHFEEALTSLDRALAIKPDFIRALYNRGVTLRALSRLEESLGSYDRVLAINPGHADALNNRGNILQDLNRFEEALASFDRALTAKPDFAAAFYNRGNLLQHIKRFGEALSSFDNALRLNPNNAEILNNRGTTLQDMKRFEEALENYNKALAINPDRADVLKNRGVTLRSMKRLDEALASFDGALAIKQNDTEILNYRGIVLRDLMRFEEALASYDRALAISPDFADALNNRGKALFESNRIQEGLASFLRAAALEKRANAPPSSEPPYKIRHDQEQQDYLAGRGDEPGALLATAAVRPDTAASNIAEQWQTATPQIVVIDNFLTDTALEALRRFCLGAPVWQKIYGNGYLGAFPEDGFASPLLGQIAEEMRSAFPAIFRAHPLRYLWAFKYDSNLSGINVHADEAAVNVNFWITPDEANLDPNHGGLVIWDKAAPLDWDFDKYNIDNAAIRDFLKKSGAKSVTVPYRANRAVIFDSDLFHETDKITFRDGYLNRRINVTLLFGRRERVALPHLA